MTTRQGLAVGLVMALVALGVAPAKAEEQPQKAQPTGEAVVGVTGQAQDPEGSAKFHEFRDVPGGLTADRLFLSWTPKEGFVFDLRAVDVSQRDQNADFSFGRQDLWRASFSWAQNPRLWTDHAKQLYAQHPGAVFTLDDALQSAIQAAPASVDTTPADGQWDAGTKGALVKGAIADSAQDVSVGWQRRTA